MARPKRSPTAQKQSPKTKRQKRPANVKSGRRGKAANDLAKAMLDDELLSKTYCEELGIDIASGTPEAVFQWCCCSCVFGSRLSEQITLRAARGMLNSGLKDPKTIKDTPLEDEIVALNSEGNVQRGPSISHYLTEMSKKIIDKYDGNLDKLRDAAEKNPEKELKLVQEFKGFGPTSVNVFAREAQAAWPELFPFADERLCEMAAKHGLPDSAEGLAELVDNDRQQFVKLLAAIVKTELRKAKVDDEKAEIDTTPLKERDEHEAKMKEHINQEKVQQQITEGGPRYPK